MVLVVTWGEILVPYSAYGGVKCSSVADDLEEYKKSSQNTAFAAIREDGSIVTWGDDDGVRPVAANKNDLNINRVI